MSLLLDTHILLWWLADDKRLNHKARAMLLDTEAVVYVSVASLWEIVIKTASGKLRVDIGAVRASIDSEEFIVLPVHAKHVDSLARLPLHHADPFDRILVAQTLSEPLRLLTHDKQLEAYGGTILLI